MNKLQISQPSIDFKKIIENLKKNKEAIHDLLNKHLFHTF